MREFKFREPINEPVLNYAPGSPERVELKKKLEEMAGQVVDIPLVIGGEEVRTGNTATGGHAPRPRPCAGDLPQSRA